MNSTVQRLLSVAIALLFVGGIVTLQDHRRKTGVEANPTPTTTARLGTLPNAGCLPLPAAGKTPSWYPADLPLTPGSYPADIKLPASSGYPRAIFAAKGTLRDFIVFVLSEWRNKGWALGRGEAEAAEAEDNFAKIGTDIRGAFIARSSFCDPGWTWVYVVMGTNRAPRPTASPTARSTPLVG